MEIPTKLVYAIFAALAGGLIIYGISTL